jgi:VWFA-related protein
VKLAGALAACACVWAAPALAQAPPVFGARVDAVYVDAFVTRDGAAVRGLTAADFELKDDGVAQKVELVMGDQLPLVAVLAFDASGSVAGAKLGALQAAGSAFLDGLKPADEAALITFNEEVGWSSAPTPDKNRIKDALAGIRARGGTAAYDGLFAAVMLPVSKARSLVVLFSDGEDNLSWLTEKQVKTIAERSNALVHAVVISAQTAPQAEPDMGTSPSPHVGKYSGGTISARPSAFETPHHRAFRQIAESTGGRLWTAESPDRLRQTFAAIAEAMSHRYVLRFEPQVDPRPGWHRLELRLRSRPGQIQARRGYWVSGSAASE